MFRTQWFSGQKAGVNLPNRGTDSNKKMTRVLIFQNVNQNYNKSFGCTYTLMTFGPYVPHAHFYPI